MFERDDLSSEWLIHMRAKSRACGSRVGVRYVDEPVIHMPMFNALCCVLLTWWIVWICWMARSCCDWRPVLSGWSLRDNGI